MFAERHKSNIPSVHYYYTKIAMEARVSNMFSFRYQQWQPLAVAAVKKNVASVNVSTTSKNITSSNSWKIALSSFVQCDLRDLWASSGNTLKDWKRYKLNFIKENEKNTLKIIILCLTWSTSTFQKSTALFSSLKHD